MNYIDIILIIPLLWGFYKGFSKGLIIEVASIIALGLAVWAGIKFCYFMTAYIHAHLGWSTRYLPIISFAIIFLGILILVYAIAKLVEKLAKTVALGFMNKLAGGIFGILKFGLVLSVMIYLLNAIEKNIRFIPDEIKQNSLLYEPVGKIAPVIIPGVKESKLNQLLPADTP